MNSLEVLLAACVGVAGAMLLAVAFGVPAEILLRGASGIAGTLLVGLCLQMFFGD